MSLQCDALPKAPPQRLEPLPYPVVFVFRDDEGEWSRVFEAAEAPPDPDELHWRFNHDPRPNWTLQTYMRLRRRGLDVRLSQRLAPGLINVLSRGDLTLHWPLYRGYLVGCRHDSPRIWLTDHTIVQNPRNVRSSNDHLIQHWPQPALRPRSEDRGARLDRLAYKGGLANLWEGFRSPEFREGLDRLGVALAIEGEPEDRTQIQQWRWHDYRETDAVLAVRDLTEADYYLKPASKLINAWLAGVPALLGPEPAYQALRRSELDYFEVRNPDEAIQAVARLKENPDLYRAMVANGQARAQEFTVDAIAARWREVLAGPVAEGYARWLRAGPVRRSLRLPRHWTRILAHRIEYRRYLRWRDHGYRPTSGRWT